MSNHPNRTQAPADLAGAIRFDAERHAETIAQWAKRNDVPVRTAEKWVSPQSPSGTMARLLAKKIAS